MVQGSVGASHILTCPPPQEPATHKQFNGLRFYSSSHPPRFEGVWWPVEVGERLCLMEKPQFPFLAARPLCAVCATKQGFVSVVQKPVPVGERLRVVQSPSQANSCRPLTSPQPRTQLGPTASCF